MDRRLPDSIATLQQVQLLRIEAEQLQAALTEGARRGKSEAAAPSADLQALLGEAPVTPALLAGTAKWLREQQAAPVVHFVLPVLPQPDLRHRLTAWVRDNLAPNLLVGFEQNRGLAGGFALRIGSAIHDYSFRRKLLDSPTAMHKVLVAQANAAATKSKVSEGSVV